MTTGPVKIQPLSLGRKCEMANGKETLTLDKLGLATRWG